MLSLGLTSVTFRELDVDTVIEYAKTSGLKAIEWGSDVHAKNIDCENLKYIKSQTENVGLRVCSYGSYYKVGEGAKSFEKYLDAARILGAPIIRIWGGTKPFDEASEDEYEKDLKEITSICNLASKFGIDIAFEFHNGTLTDSCEHAVKVIKDASCENLGMYFQYDKRFSLEQNCSTLKSFLPYLKMVHVFNIDADSKRFPIGEHGGKDIWRSFIKILKENNAEVCMLFEFLPQNNIECLKKETAVMAELVGEENVF